VFAEILSVTRFMQNGTDVCACKSHTNVVQRTAVRSDIGRLLADIGIDCRRVSHAEY